MIHRMNASIAPLLAGFLLLFFGRRLFWLFVGILGFLAGFALATRFFPHETGLTWYFIAIGFGLIGILLAFFLQKMAIAIGGFLAGGFFLVNTVQSVGSKLPEAVLFLIGGILGAILLSLLFDWALIFLSSVTGASLLAKSLPFDRNYFTIVLIGLVILGVFVQARFLRPRRPVRSAS
jgi:MFS family permease